MASRIPWKVDHDQRTYVQYKGDAGEHAGSSVNRCHVSVIEHMLTIGHHPPKDTYLGTSFGQRHVALPLSPRIFAFILHINFHISRLAPHCI
jgi:hypothetical protein